MDAAATATAAATTPSPEPAEPVEPVEPVGPAVRYLRPGWFTRRLFNPAFGRMARLGLSPKGLRELAVVGRSTGEVRTTPVNLLGVDGHRYLVAPRGATQWVRNIRVSGGGALRVGRRREDIAVAELADADKPEVLREYLRRWRSEVKVFFDGIDVDATDEQLAVVAPGFPVFEVHAAGGG